MVEQAQIRALNGSWKGIGRILLASFIGFCAIAFWGPWRSGAVPGNGIPATSPEGPKVWRDQLNEAAPQET